jgi:hypothetical protein
MAHNLSMLKQLHMLLLVGAMMTQQYLLLLHEAAPAKAAAQAGSFSIDPFASLVAVGATSGTPTVEAAALPIRCPPPTDNGSFPFPLVTSNFCGSLGLSTPNSEIACLLWGPIQGLVAYNKGNPLDCDNQAPFAAVTHPRGGLEGSQQSTAMLRR